LRPFHFSTRAPAIPCYVFQSWTLWPKTLPHDPPSTRGLAVEHKTWNFAH
jgi:hypothetical protein